jgi:hypothetical protein
MRLCYVLPCVPETAARGKLDATGVESVYISHLRLYCYLAEFNIAAADARLVFFARA